jgi:hypothetical protein
MTTRAVLLFALVISISLVGRAEQGQPTMEKEAAMRAAQRIQPGTYKGPGGQTIQVKQAMGRGGKASDLAAKGIIIVEIKPTGKAGDESAKGIIITENKPTGKAGDESAKGIVVIDTKPADGTYTAPNGTSFVVQRGFIITEAFVYDPPKSLPRPRIPDER